MPRPWLSRMIQPFWRAARWTCSCSAVSVLPGFTRRWRSARCGSACRGQRRRRGATWPLASTTICRLPPNPAMATRIGMPQWRGVPVQATRSSPVGFPSWAWASASAEPSAQSAARADRAAPEIVRKVRRSIAVRRASLPLPRLHPVTQRTGLLTPSRRRDPCGTRSNPSAYSNSCAHRHGVAAGSGSPAGGGKGRISHPCADAVEQRPRSVHRDAVQRPHARRSAAPSGWPPAQGLVDRVCTAPARQPVGSVPG